MQLDILQKVDSRKLFWILGSVLLLFGCISAWREEPIWLLIPFMLPVVYVGVRQTSWIYFLLLFSVPFSSETNITAGTQLDLPAEPLMIALLGVSVIWLLMNKKPWGTIIQHPVSLFLGAHLVWMLVSAVDSVAPVVSAKFILAKFWFMAAFYVCSWFFLSDQKSVKKLFWLLYVPILVTTSIALVRHALLGFSFEVVNEVVVPFYRNHVDYASMLALFYPFVVLARKWYPKGSLEQKLILVGLVLLPVGVYFSFTRAAIGILFLYPLLYMVLHFRWVKLSIGAGLLGVALLVGYYLQDKTYMELAPNYERTIYHDEFGNLLEATYKLEDLSTMERLYRWVAAGHMVTDRPWTGTGPGTFYPIYQRYTVSGFQTYMSDNPERSGVHNYYLMVLTDQGFIGLAFWVIFVLFVLWFTEKIYHDHANRDERALLAALFCVFGGILIINGINDMIENLKVGALFFIVLALITLIAQRSGMAPPIQSKD